MLALSVFCLFCTGLDTSLKLSSELVESVQSFAAFLQHQVESAGLQDKGPLQANKITSEAVTAVS